MPTGETVRSFTVVTAEPNERCAPIHDRVPVIVDPTSGPIWLGEEPATTDALKAMLVPYRAAGMTCWPVSKRVGNFKNNDPSLIEPI